MKLFTRSHSPLFTLHSSLVLAAAAAGSLALAVPPPYRPVGPETGVRGEPTGFFHVETIDGRDWMVDPVGRGVYLAGVDWCMPLALLVMQAI